MKLPLHSFTKQYGLPKTSVHRKCQELGYDTKDGITKEQANEILVLFGKAPAPQQETKDIAASSAAIVPAYQTVEVLPIETSLVARRIEPKVVAYDTTEIDQITQLNMDTIEYNLNAMGRELIEQVRHTARMQVACARQAYANEIATGISEMASGNSKSVEK
jgi:hypothetical protein